MDEWTYFCVVKQSIRFCTKSDSKVCNNDMTKIPALLVDPKGSNVLNTAERPHFFSNKDSKMAFKIV